MTLAIVIVVALAVVATAAIAFGRPLSLSYKGLKAVVEQTARTTADIRQTVGDGGGSVLDELAEIRAEQAQVKATLEARTLILRHGAVTPEDLGQYTQERMHDILSEIAKVALKVDTIWVFLQAHGFDLPVLSPQPVSKKED